METIKRVWGVNEDVYSPEKFSHQVEKLPVSVYLIGRSMFGYYLEKIEDKFEFTHKIYGLERSLIDRVKRTYEGGSSNLGILLNGIKGTGKTVTAKQICNELSLPVILINQAFENMSDVAEFIADIEQDVIVFFDEYEKIFKDGDDSMLTIMDGALNNEFRKVFLLTTNNLRINDNLIQRPGRIRYLKTFGNLTLENILEIVEDKLKFPEFKDETIQFISQLELITVDIVSAIVQEVNIHQESPSNFENVFNVEKIRGSHDVYKISKGTNGKATEEKIFSGANVSPYYISKEHSIGDSLYINKKYFGEIEEVIDNHTVRVSKTIEEGTPGEPNYKEYEVMEVIKLKSVAGKNVTFYSYSF